MKNIKLTSLTENEYRSISGGESAWYWVAYYGHQVYTAVSTPVHVGSWADK